MPGLDGLEATRRLLAGLPVATAPRVIVLTTFDIDEYVYAALQSGASGFLLKDVTPGAARRRRPHGVALATRCWRLRSRAGSSSATRDHPSHPPATPPRSRP